MASSEKDEENESASPCHQGSHSQVMDEAQHTILHEGY